MARSLDSRCDTAPASSSGRARLLVVSRSVPAHPASGGMETVAWDLATELHRTFDVDVLTTEIDNLAAGTTSQPRTLRVKGSRPGRYSLRWWIQTARFDLTPYAAVLSVSAGATAMILRHKSPPFIMQAHGTAARELSSVVHGRGRLWVLKAVRLAWWVGIDFALYRKCDVVVSIGPAVTEALTAGIYRRAWKRGRQPSEIPNGVRAGEVAEGCVGGARDTVAFVGRLTRQKGVDRVISAMVLSDLKLNIVGDGPEREALEDLAAQLNVGERVTFYGHLEAPGVREVLRSSDALIFVPRQIEREGFPVSVLEALAEKLPVITLMAPLWPEGVREQLTFVSDALPLTLNEAMSRGVAARATELPYAYTQQAMAVGYARIINDAISKGDATRRKP